MAGCDFLLKALDSSEINELSQPIKGKLESFLGSIEDQLTEAKSRYENLRVNSEQQYNELERKLITTVSQLETVSAAKSDLRNKLEELEKKLSEEDGKLSSIRSDYEKAHEAELKFTRLAQELEADKKELTDMVQKKDKKIDALNEEWKNLTEKVSAGDSLRCELQAKLSEYQSRDVTREFKESKLVQERDQLLERVEWLNNQVTEKCNALIADRKEKSVKVLELMSQLEVKTEELSHVNDVVAGLKKTNGDQGIKINELIQKLKDARDAQMQSDEQFRQEIKAQTKLVDLYKDSASDNEKKVEEVVKAVEDMQNMLKNAAEAHKELKEQGRLEIDQCMDQIHEKELRVENLEEELRNANDLIVKIKGEGNMSLGALETLYPTAAATSKILKTGMTLTEIYSEYVKVSDNLQVEKAESSQLRIYLDEIGKELEEKAPLLVRQREDYEAALQSNNRMTTQLNAAMVEREELLKDRDQQKRKSNFLERENQRLQQQTIDLGRQVKRLVQEISELRGGPIVRESSVVSSSVDVTAADVVTENLVTFRNVEELQEQNQRLLTLVREFSEKKEQEEQEAVNIKTEDLKEQLETALLELSTLQSGRQRQEELVKSIVRQRDMYKVMLQNSANTLLPSTPEITTSSPMKGGSMLSIQANDLDKQLSQTKDALKQLQSDFNTYKVERNENEKILNEQIEEARNRESELRVENAKLSSRLDFSAERNKVQQNNIDSYKKEVTALSNRCQKYSTQVMKLEQTVSTLRDDLMSAQENLSRYEIQNQNLRSEKDLLKNSEQHILQEVERIRRENSSQNQVMLNLQAIQNNLERVDFENKSRLNQQLDNKDKELASLHRKLDNIQEDHKSSIRHWENLVRQLQTEVSKEREGIRAEKAKIDEAQSFINNLKQELSTTEAKLSAAEIKLSNSNLAGDDSMNITAVSMSIEEIKDLKSQLNQANNKIKGLEKACEESRKQLEQYKEIASNVEESIKQQNQTSEEFQQALEKRMAESNLAKDKLENHIETLEKENEELREQSIKVTEEAHNLNSDLRKQLSNVQSELMISVERRETAISTESAAKNKCEQQVKIAAEAQDKYERELILHAADVEALTSFKQQLENINEPVVQLQEEVKKLENQLLESQTSWAEQENLLKEGNKILEDRCNDLSNQNKLLHDQMSKLSGQVSTIQHKSTDTANMSFSEESEKSSDQLLEVIKFLRREKEIAEMKMEVSEIECNRLKLRFEHLVKQLEEANNSLTAEREDSQVALQTASQHADIMKKIENVNILSDSNKILREERDRLKQEQVTFEARVKKMEEDINPLQARVRDLESQKDILTVEKTTLQQEVTRWKSRTNHFIERHNKQDPEEHKKVIQEKETLKRQVSTLTEEITKQKAEISRLNGTINNLQTELNTAKQENMKLNQQMLTLKTQEATKQATDTEEKNKTINQLKKIGRKYKEQAEKTSKELEDYKKKVESEKQTSDTSSAGLEEMKKELTEKLNTVEKEKNEVKQVMDQLNQDLNQHKEQINELNKERANYEERKKKFEEDIAEYEKKQTQSRNVLSTAKSKITTQKEQIEKQNVEINELKVKVNDIERQTREESEMRLNTLKSQYDYKINRLEKELSSLRNPTSVTTSTNDNQQQLDQVLKENTELQSKIQQLQKQVENLSKQQQQQQMVTPQQATRTPVTAASIPTSESLVKTANIKPMATSTAPVRPSAPIQHQHQHPSAAARVTASIRPMAMAPTTSVGGITPTATVMPTTLSQQELTDETSSASGPSASIPAVSVTPRLTQQVQIVTPQVETINNDTAMESSTLESSAVSPIATVLTHDTSSSGSPIPIQQSVTPVAQHPSVTPVTPQPASVAVTPQTNVTPISVPPQGSVTPVTPQPSITQVTHHQTTPITPQPSSSGTQVVTPQPSTSGAQLGKRQREDTDSQEESDSYTKRTRTQSQEQGIPAITVTDEHAQTITHLSPQSSALLKEQSQTDRRRQAVAPRNQQYPTSGATPIGIDDDEDDGEIIVLGSDDEEQAYEMEDYRESDDKNMKAYTEMDDEEEYEEDDDDEDDDEDDYDDEESDEIGESNQEDSNDVVIIDDTEQSQQRRESDEVEQVTSSAQQAIPIQTVVDATSRPTSTDLQTRSQSLTPFMLGNQPGLFEEEDGLVPSTPTLFIPVRRSDGFAEAISSPAAPQRFVFGGDNSSNQPELAQLESQRALGMDDTRMDLSQLDEGRVPVTPSQVVPRSAASTDNTSTISATPVTPAVSASTSSDTSATTSTVVTEESGQPAIEFEDDDEALLEGLQGDEDNGEETTQDTETGEGVTESMSSTDQPEEVPSTSSDLTQDDDDDKATGDSGAANRPKIQRIVWGAQETNPSAQTPPTSNQGRGGRAPRRGRGSAWRGPSRGGPRGGFRPF